VQRAEGENKKEKAGGREEMIGDWIKNEGRVGDPRVYL